MRCDHSVRLRIRNTDTRRPASIGPASAQVAANHRAGRETLRLYQDAGVQAIKPNRGEALALLGPSPPGESDVDHILANGPRLLHLTGVPLAAVTLDRDGAIMLERERTPHRVFARAQASPNTAGAGDTYIATLAVALSAGASRPQRLSSRAPPLILP